jgi:predicted nucleotidyltransferase
MLQPFLEEKREQIAELCRTHHVRRLAVFGSAVRDDFDPVRSDVDLLVEFEPIPFGGYADNFWELEDRFASLLGRHVDLIKAGSIENPFILKRISQDQVQIYAA